MKKLAFRSIIGVAACGLASALRRAGAGQGDPDRRADADLGSGSYFGVMGKEGIDLALEQAGKTDLKGYRLQVQYEDSACSPLQATNTVKRVLDQFKPHIVIGEECSDASLAIAPILEQAKVVRLTPAR